MPDPPSTRRLKRTQSFSAVYRRGRWVRGRHLSLGTRPTRAPVTRVGLRTKRGLKGAVVRNRLKRQMRALVFGRSLPLKRGVDMVIVIHPTRTPIGTPELERELRTLLLRAGAIC